MDSRTDSLRTQVSGVFRVPGPWGPSNNRPLAVKPCNNPAMGALVVVSLLLSAGLCWAHHQLPPGFDPSQERDKFLLHVVCTQQIVRSQTSCVDATCSWTTQLLDVHWAPNG